METVKLSIFQAVLVSKISVCVYMRECMDVGERMHAVECMRVCDEYMRLGVCMRVYSCAW